MSEYGSPASQPPPAPVAAGSFSSATKEEVELYGIESPAKPQQQVTPATSTAETSTVGTSTVPAETSTVRTSSAQTETSTIGTNPPQTETPTVATNALPKEISTVASSSAPTAVPYEQPNPPVVPGNIYLPIKTNLKKFRRKMSSLSKMRRS